jgi:hypothetical protein
MCSVFLFVAIAKFENALCHFFGKGRFIISSLSNTPGLCITGMHTAVFVLKTIEKTKLHEY